MQEGDDERLQEQCVAAFCRDAGWAMGNAVCPGGGKTTTWRDVAGCHCWRPPSLDMHQEPTFLVTIPFSTVYNNLIPFDPHGYPNIIGDLAKSWTVSNDKTT